MAAFVIGGSETLVVNSLLTTMAAVLDFIFSVLAVPDTVAGEVPVDANRPNV